jgi:hypothetical protein
LGNVSQPLKQRAQIKTSTHGENREAPALPQTGENRERHLTISSRCRCFFWAEHINQVVRNSVPLARCRFSRANIEAAKELRGIACDHFATKLLSEPNA